jgi:hypothetical protein
MPAEGAEKPVRDRFHRLLKAREDAVALAEARDWILAILADIPAKSLASLENPSASPQAGGDPVEWNPDILAYHAPLALTEGAWLQSLALAANGHLEATGELFAAYLALLGREAADSPACAYRGLLARHAILLPEVRAWRFAHDPRVGAPALHCAAIGWALGLHAAEFFPEALGYMLAYARSAAPWMLPALEGQARRSILAEMEARALRALAIWRRQGGDESRAMRGHALHGLAEADYRTALAEFVAHPPSLAARVEAMIRRKRPFARGYHAGVMLAGRPLEDWFAQEPFDGPGFLAAFAASPYAKGAPGARPFERLTAFGGPMFGVFDREELALLNAWLSVAGAVCNRDLVASSVVGAVCNRDLVASSVAVKNRSHGTDDVRGLFHRLINNDLSVQDAARRRVESALARARRGLSRSGPLARRFFDYSPEALAHRIEDIHREEVARRRPFQPPPKLSREAYLFGIRQFAPAILADGCWLQHQGEAADQDSRMHRLLYRIYAEELGEGRPDWNHPKVYRDLLEKLGIALPPLDSETFARHPDFLDAAFDLPVYLMAISRFPRSYLPELLGLNLSIELSGLGAGYAGLADELRHWRIDPLIVTLHQSIDNLAGGHAAMAAEAIQLYLDDIERLGGRAALNDAWRRVWIGRLSLEAATRRFKWAAILAFLWRFRLKRAIAGNAAAASPDPFKPESP